MISDEMLAEQALRGTLPAFEELVNRYKNQIFSVVYRLIGHYQESEDVTQDVFFTVYEKLYQFDTRKKFGPWIYRIAVNTSISALRRKKKVVNLNFDESYSFAYEYYPLSNMGDPQYAFERKEMMEEINSAIMELSDSYRVVLVLRYQMDFSNKEISTILGVSRENVEVRIHRARKALRKIFLRRWEERGKIDGLPASR